MNVNAHAIVKSSNHSLNFFQYMLKCYGLWLNLKWRPVVSFEMALHSNTLFTVRRNIELYGAVPYLQFTFVFSELKCYIN